MPIEIGRKIAKKYRTRNYSCIFFQSPYMKIILKRKDICLEKKAKIRKHCRPFHNILLKNSQQYAIFWLAKTNGRWREVMLTLRGRWKNKAHCLASWRLDSKNVWLSSSISYSFQDRSCFLLLRHTQHNLVRISMKKKVDLSNEVVSNKSFGNKSLVGSQSWTELIHEIGGLIQAKYWEDLAVCNAVVFAQCVSYQICSPTEHHSFFRK